MMSTYHAKIDGIHWEHADVRNMPMVEDQSIDVALDKGTLDAMVYGSCWDPPDEVKTSMRSYMHEIHRVLKDDGLFLCITFRQPRFMGSLLDPDGSLWHVDMQELSNAPGTFPYYGYVVRKRASLDDESNPEAETQDTQSSSHTVHEESTDEGVINGLKPGDDDSTSEEEEEPDILRSLFD